MGLIRKASRGSDEADGARRRRARAERLFSRRRHRREAPRPPGGRQRPHRPDVGPLAGRLDRRAHRLRARLRRHGLRDGPVPPSQRRRGAAAGALQPADRGAVHDRADHRRGRLLLPHRHVAERHAGRGQEPRPHGHRRRQQVAVGLQLPRRGRHPGRRRLRLRHPRGPGRAVAPGQRVGALRAQVARRHPLVLDPGVLLQDGRRAGPPELLRPDPDPRGHLHRTVRRAVRALPLTHALRGPRRPARRVRHSTCPSSRRPATSALPREPPRPTRSQVCNEGTKQDEDVQDGAGN